jgi:hypothetical protein
MAESRLTTNSGAEVPNATTVRPITIGVTPRPEARLDEPFTRTSAPYQSNIKPVIHISKVRYISGLRNDNLCLNEEK